MAGKSYTWHLLAADPQLLSWQANGIAVAEAGGKKLCVAKHDGNYRAFAYTCPHAGGIMANGWIDALGNVVCPLHRYRFDSIKGRNTSGEGYHLKTYPMRMDETGLHVGIEVPGIYG